MKTYHERPAHGGGWEACANYQADVRDWFTLLPCLMTGPNANKCHAGTKGQTRRLLRKQPKVAAQVGPADDRRTAFAGDGMILKPRFRVGDFFFIQETWRTERRWNKVRPTMLPENAEIRYEADGAALWRKAGKIRPAIFLQNRFARLARYQVTAVRLERVSAISEADALAEGCERLPNPHHPAEDPYADERWRDYITGGSLHSACASFRTLWNSIHDAPGTRFEDAPFVFCYDFRRVR